MNYLFPICFIRIFIAYRHTRNLHKFKIIIWKKILLFLSKDKTSGIS